MLVTGDYAEAMRAVRGEQAPAEGVIVATALTKATHNIFFHPLAAYPGPVAYRASELPRLIQEITGNTVHKWAELHAKYGPVVRIAPGQLSYISNDAWRDIYTAKSTSESPDLPKTTAEARQMSREEMTFPGNEFEFFSRTRPRLEEHAVKQQAVDAVAWFNFCHVRHHKHPGLWPQPWGNRRSRGLGALVGRLVPRRLIDEAAAHVQVVRDLVERRIAMPEDPTAPDFMSHILKRNEADGGRSKSSNLSRDELYLDAQLLAIAGSETTATLLTAAVHLLSANPRAPARLVATLRAEFKTEEDLTATRAARSVPYVAAVVSEALRLHPPGAINMPRTVPAGGAIIAGRFMAGSSTVGFAQYAAYRSSAHFADPLAFVPERWVAGMEGGQNQEAATKIRG
ncbi:hypothetical protein MAPG_02958 [Magnaporthiopsis poae ATCC 64411]|uniref:Cytochrome P450 n=1 Tax=Magnaporthiopsis poae (strain ATCC 64411 / 73-15) TaxID=644358 RepID=A0A0C4DSS0_MAGP6|nr:hypothetical protein MAPG_02958 [Magnaporthiopsis poae ATCC 64411]